MMKAGKIKESRIKNKMIEITIIYDMNKQIKDNLTINDSTIRIRKGDECIFELADNKLGKLIINNTNVLEMNQKESKVQSLKLESGKDKPSSASNSGTNQAELNDSATQGKGEVAKAPYNFIPINSKVVKARKQEDGIIIAESSDGKSQYPEIPSFDRYHEGLNTGYIDLNIEALTPLYIRDAYKQDEEKRTYEAKIRDEKWENPEFFSPGGTPKIPGSSLRGMVRNLLEIVSCSQLKYVEDKRFYYRKVAVPGRYQTLMIKGSKNRDGLRPATEAGWLKKEKGKYYIYPLEKQQVYRIDAKVSGDSWKVVMKDDEDKEYSQELAKFDFYPVSFIPAKEKAHPHRGGKIRLSYALIINNSLEIGHEKAELDSNYKKGYLVLSGSMGRNKHMHPVIHGPKDEGRVEIDQDLIESYIADISREPKADLFKMLEKYPGGIPCFYLIDNKGNIKSIGHTPLFRLAYDKKVKDHLPAEHKSNTVIDFTEAIFGNADKFAGRVFFEDARIVNNPGQYQELSPQILSTPKPTTVQHYLKQEGSKLLDWNDHTDIRGYKLYWHRKTPQEGDYGWEAIEDEINKAKSQYTKIKPVYEGATFSGRIRYETSRI